MTAFQNREDYFYFYDVSTRWMDNDVYGHINNVQYYSYFDSIVNKYLIEVGNLDIKKDPIVGFVVASNCEYLTPLAYPDILEIGLAVTHIGNSSVSYKIGVLKGFTHVFVNRKTGKSVKIPMTIKNALLEILSDN